MGGMWTLYRRRKKRGKKINIRNTLVNGIYWLGLPTYTFIRLHSMFKILDLIIVFDFCSVIHHRIATEHFCTLFNMKNKIPFEPDHKGVKLFMKQNSHFKAPGFLQNNLQFLYFRKINHSVPMRHKWAKKLSEFLLLILLFRQAI